MLIKFTVENYEGFKNELDFDLTSNKRYDYNQDMVDKKVVKKVLIYGENGTGKSSLCSALMDITYHIVDKMKYFVPNDKYFYAGSNQKKAIFTYTFKFDKKIVKYEYCKSSPTSLAYEKLFINEEEVLSYNFFDSKRFTNKLEETKTLNIQNLPQEISVIKFIYNNTKLSEKSIIYKIVDYVSRMLYFKSLSEGNYYIGYSNTCDMLSSIIIKHNKVDEFKTFLVEQGLHYDLVKYANANGTEELGVRFENNKIMPFNSIISSGTNTMELFYCWMLEFQNLSMLIIDEFDAYYHYQTAQAILKIINSYKEMQAIITTHNMMLMNNDLTRPDCCYIMNDNKITPLYKLTKKEIRMKNNLSKMYINGEFSNFLE